MPELDGLGLAGIGITPKEYRFYGGAVSIFYDDDIHQYTRFTAADELVVVPGVTTAVHVLDKSEALTQWASNQCAGYIESKIEEERATYIAAVGIDTGIFSVGAETILSWLNDARFAFRVYKDAAAETGKIAHDWVEQYIRSFLKGGDITRRRELMENMPEDERARCGAEAALKWIKGHNVRWVCTERKIYSRIFDYAGTLDGLAYIDSCGDPECCGRVNLETGARESVYFENVLAIIDWKTSNRLYVEYEYQTVAYLKAQEEEHGYQIPLRFIIRLGKEDAEFESRLLFEDTIERDFQIYLECLALYRSVEGRKQNERAVRIMVKALLKAQKEAAVAFAKAEKKAAKELLKIQKQMMFEDFRTQGMTIKAAKAAVSAAFAALETEDDGVDVVECGAQAVVTLGQHPAEGTVGGGHGVDADGLQGEPEGIAA